MKNATLQAFLTVKTFLDAAQKVKNAYFWQSPDKASTRRYQEEILSFPSASFVLNDRKYTIAIDVQMSCKNVYVDKQIIRDGDKTTQTALMSDLKKEIARELRGKSRKFAIKKHKKQQFYFWYLYELTPDGIEVAGVYPTRQKAEDAKAKMTEGEK